MPPSLAVLARLHLEVSLNSAQAVGIPIALVGAVFLSLGAQFQSRGVTKVEERSGAQGDGLGFGELLALLRRPSWVLGTVMLGLAIVLQLTSLRFAPLIVVQPLGAIALVVTAILNARVTRTPLNPRTVRAIALCVGGVAVFVTVAAFVATDLPISDADLLTIVLTLAVVLVVLGSLYAIFRKRMTPIAYIIGAGVLYGFVATIAKTVINRILQSQFDLLTAVCLLGLLAAGFGGLYLVQTAYSVGPPDLVIAGLTVVDPIVAVGIGVVVLHEAAGAPWWAPILFLLTGAVAVFGVFQLARYHPQLQSITEPAP
ncbi:DMT family transporter [Amnibacterium sp. CER49]|uniref:DMT family transporter n=1 Tax=Amnibacterium sp. CER49 TaxID=3039161 RepID=UPI0024496CF6|nr:DMT family transporter [Amnibacterium sp. CER49]MDH2442387.1 DMT family transporter [Amnibacterium sp. CER49]